MALKLLRDEVEGGQEPLQSRKAGMQQSGEVR